MLLASSHGGIVLILVKHNGRVEVTNKLPAHYENLWLHTNSINEAKEVVTVLQLGFILKPHTPPTIETHNGYTLLAMRVLVFKDGKGALILLNIVYGGKNSIR